MLAVVPSATLHGLDGRSIRVEVDVAPGLPGFTVVGLGDTAVQEARERVRGAIRNAGFAFPPRRITVNLAPAELRKAGRVARPRDRHRHPARVGAGARRAGPGRAARRARPRRRGPARCPGILPMVAAIAARRVGRVVVAPAAVDEARLVEGIEVVGAGDAGRGRRGRARPAAAPGAGRDAAGHDRRPARTRRRTSGRRPLRRPAAPIPDLAEVRGQAEARRALEIALAGGHGLLLTGPPGVGKTLLARTIPGLLPPLDDAAALAVSIVASAAGEGPITALRRRAAVPRRRTTRCPTPAMVGGGPNLSPGRDHAGPPRACCSSTSWPSSTATCSRRSGSRSRRAGS